MASELLLQRSKELTAMENELLQKSSFEQTPAPRSQVRTKRTGVSGDQISTMLLNADVLIKHGEKHLARYLIQQALNLKIKQL